MYGTVIYVVVFAANRYCWISILGTRVVVDVQWYRQTNNLGARIVVNGIAVNTHWYCWTNVLGARVVVDVYWYRWTNVSGARVVVDVHRHRWTNVLKPLLLH